MIQFEKLRIQGFKSFVDRTELEIGPGLNGVVGPNGCGKSNLVEALRWVMGESSAKRMRGGSGGMEDVIFSGTDKRAPRNLADVSLLLNNSARLAPAAYNNSDDLEITRRIERDRGSNYKINGKNARARDVQMLFADNVTGANSPAMVSQGRVAEIINAKPLNRRLILEESAGISGLFARRHEAELRLKAADANLLRLEDIVGTMEGRFQALKRQAKQAARYRNINTQIRHLELLIAYLEYEELDSKQQEIKASFAKAESQTAEMLISVTQLTKTQSTQAEEIPPLRQSEVDAAAALQVQNLALEKLEHEEAQLKQSIMDTKSQLAQNKSDYKHEEQSLAESAVALEKMQDEHEGLILDENNDSGKKEEKQSIVEQLEEKVLKLEAEYNTLIQEEADKKARQHSLEQQIAQNSKRLDTMNERKEKAQTDLELLLEGDHNTSAIETLISDITGLEKQSETLSQDISTEHKAHDALNPAIETARVTLAAAQAQQSEYNAEMAMLDSFFAGTEDQFYPILDDVQAKAGFEKALSRALGDSLMASRDQNAPSLWSKRKTQPHIPDLPEGAEALLPYIAAPEELHLALSQIGFVDHEKKGEALCSDLAPGQSLVSANGSYWRWDGYIVKAEAADRHSVHLEQKNKMSDLKTKKPEIEKELRDAEIALENILKSQSNHQEARAQLQNDLRSCDHELTRKRSDLSALREANARFDSDRSYLESALETVNEDIRTLHEVITWDQGRLETLLQSINTATNEKVNDLRVSLSDAREELQNALRAFDMFQQKQNSRAARIRAIADERVNLKNRSIRAQERLASLEERQKNLQAKIDIYNQQPQDFADEREKFLTRISEYEEKRTKSAEMLIAAESALEETNRALKEAQEKLSISRETRAGAQATLSGVQEQIRNMALAVREKFDLNLSELKTNLNVDLDKIGALSSLRAEKEKFLRERDAMGPVNLRADNEALELESELGGLLNEKNDLTQAIEELRSGIQTINKEARERLTLAFEHVNAHFKRLFVRLFDGGQAHLALVDSDDPLESGLEIFAQPPGKSLQSLSLMSGGEQTMASIALIFAMFLTNPSPICVLDEIDAPLDDSNVDRVCNLLDEIAERGETRFLIITHHRLTMARMDRLYGVTMSEKGVSQLVSVDLQQSFEFLDEAA